MIANEGEMSTAFDEWDEGRRLGALSGFVEDDDTEISILRDVSFTRLEKRADARWKSHPRPTCPPLSRTPHQID